MKTYELTYILSSHLSTEDVAKAASDIDAFIQGKGGVIVKSEKTAAKMLSYPIKKHTSGYFITSELQIPEAPIREIKELLEKNANVLRHIILIKKPAKEMKVRRKRKLATPLQGEHPAPAGPEHSEGQPEKVQMEDINKKLDEILGQ